MNKLPVWRTTALMMTVVLCISCTQQKASGDVTDLTWQTVQDSTDRIHSIEGFSGPEAVRYDPQQDVYFVANFTGGGNDRDANGFISRVSPDGSIDSLRFMTGTEAHPLHAPRGMYIVGDTLWAADVDGVHGFDRLTGRQVLFIDFREFEPGFLNDIAQGPDGSMYVTDTGSSKLYRITNREVSVAADSLPYAPNGATLNLATGVMVLAPWGGTRTFQAWDPATSTLQTIGEANGGGNFDGIEFVGNRLLSASQRDSSIHLMENAVDRLLIHVAGRPADIGLDTRRNQIAVPYISLDRVDIWQLPGN